MLISAEKQAEILLSLKKKLEKPGETQGIPVSIFKKLSALEAITRYMKDEQKLSFNEIGKILNRSSITIRTSYNNSFKKFKGKLDTIDTKHMIPFNIFQNRKKSILEHIVSYLKDKYDLNFKTIAEILNKNYQTIWTVYRRANAKQQ